MLGTEYFMPLFFNETDTIEHTMINAFLKGMRSFYYACLSFDMQFESPVFTF